MFVPQGCFGASLWFSGGRSAIAPGSSREYERTTLSWHVLVRLSMAVTWFGEVSCPSPLPNFGISPLQLPLAYVFFLFFSRVCFAHTSHHIITPLIHKTQFYKTPLNKKKKKKPITPQKHATQAALDEVNAKIREYERYKQVRICLFFNRVMIVCVN